MGYPVAYRNPSPHSGFRPAPRPSADIIPFRRPPRGTFGPPTGLGGSGNFGRAVAGEVVIDAPGIAGFLGRRAVPWLAAGLAAFNLWDAFNSPTRGALPDAGAYLAAHGYQLVLDCPKGYNCASDLLFPDCTLPLPGEPRFLHLSSPTPFNIFLIKNTFDVYAPDPEHYVLILLHQQWRLIDPFAVRDNVSVIQPGFVNSYGVYISGQTYPAPNDAAVIDMPLPFPFVPDVPSAPRFPQQSIRGDDVRGFIHGDFDDDADAPRTHTRNRVDPFAPPSPPRRPPVREKERKVESASKLGRVALGGFRALSTLGSANGIVDAMWRSLPNDLRSHGRVGIGTKYRELFHAWDRVQMDEAFVNALGYWVRYKLAGALYGRVARSLTDHAGVNTGWSIYRGLANAEGFRPRPPHPARTYNTYGGHSWSYYRRFHRHVRRPYKTRPVRRKRK